MFLARPSTSLLSAAVPSIVVWQNARVCVCAFHWFFLPLGTCDLANSRQSNGFRLHFSFLKRNFYKRCLLISANMNNLRKSLVISAAKGLSHPHWSISLGKHNYTRLPPTLFKMTVAMNEDSNVNFTLTVNVIRTGEKHGSVRRLERMECNGHWSLKKWNIFLFVKKMTRLRNKL